MFVWGTDFPSKKLLHVEDAVYVDCSTNICLILYGAVQVLFVSPVQAHARCGYVAVIIFQILKIVPTPFLD